MPHHKLIYRRVSKSSDERTLIASVLDGCYPCGDSLFLFVPAVQLDDEIRFVEPWVNSLSLDFMTRFLTNGNNTLTLFSMLPAPDHALDEFLASPLSHQRKDLDRGLVDASFAELFELTPAEYAYILSTFPLLDRDQPPLPGDHRVRPTNKGTDRRRQSFITHDLALLTYFDYLAGRLDAKPDPERVSRICPGGVPEPPTDIVAFFTEAGVDIAGSTDRAVAETGPIRNLRERVRVARELGAVAYVPTIDRRRASFVERAAEAGGLSPDEGVLTPEMAERVLRDKAERDAKWQRAMSLWQNIPEPSRPGMNGARSSPQESTSAVSATP